MNVPSKPDDPAASDSDSIDHSKPENESEILSAVGMKWINYWESKIDANLAQLELALLNKLPKNSLDDENGVGGENDDKVEVAERHFNELKKECNEIYCKYLKLDVQNSRLEREMHQLRQQLRDTANRNRCLEQQLQQQKATSIAKDYSLRSLNSSFSLNSKSIGHPLPSPQPAACPIRFVEDEHEIRNLRHENRHIRRQLTEIRNDLFGAKLSAKYLDKELSGRIQQIQILSNDELRVSDRSHLWDQIEAEIRLVRHKAVMQSCQARSASNCCLKTPYTPDVAPGHRLRLVVFGSSLPETRQVLIEREDKEPLGISIMCGKENGIPIIVSGVRIHSPASRCGRLYVGDAILSVNQIDLTHHTHKEAACILMEQSGNCLLECVFLPPEPDPDFWVSHEKYEELDELSNEPYEYDDNVDEPESPDTLDDDRMSSVTDAAARTASKLYPGSAEPLLENLRI